MRKGRQKAERIIMPEEREQLSAMALAQSGCGPGLVSATGFGLRKYVEQPSR
jgi:hypothetical protein